MGAATRYLNQRYSMKDGKVVGTLTDIGIEENYCALAKMCETGRANRPAFVVMHFLLPV